MEPNSELFSKIFTQITRHPETYDASTWNNCIAGWAWRIEHGEELMPIPSHWFSGVHVQHAIESAASLLGLSIEHASTLFYDEEWLQLEVTGLFAEERNVEAFEKLNEIIEEEKEEDGEW